MKVDLERLAELKASLAAMDQGLEEIVIRAARKLLDWLKTLEVITGSIMWLLPVKL